MALPNPSTGLLNTNATPDADLNRLVALHKLPFKITWGAVVPDNLPQAVEQELAELGQAVRIRPDRKAVERLQQLERQYPDVPVFKNYLTMAYMGTGQKSRAMNLLDQTVQQFPHYIPAIVSKATHLIAVNDVAGVDKLLGGPPTDIQRFLPERTEFHASEVGHFYMLAFRYALAVNDTATAENQLRLLRDLNYHDKGQLRAMKEQLDRERMRINMERMQESFEDAVSIDGYFRADDQQTTEPPVFEHPEVQWLYEYGLIETNKPLPADKRDELLSLPRPSLTRDLSKVLLDTVYRYDQFMDQDWDDSRHNFAGHALLLATELRADECLDAVLETLRQDGDFREFWWGDWLTDFYEPYFRRMLPGQAESLKAFMLEPDVNTYSKVTISEAVMQEGLANPAFKPAAQVWYTDVLTHLVDHAHDEHLFDSDLIAFVIGDITDLQFTDLLPQIRIAYTRDLVTENIHGDLADTEREMVEPRYAPDRRTLRSMADQYEFLRNPVAYRKAHPEPPREKFKNDFIDELERKQDEWAFLYEDELEEPSRPFLPPTSSPFLSPLQPIAKQPAPNRNDKVSVRYADGTVVRDVKYKKVEADVQAGKCSLLS